MSSVGEQAALWIVRLRDTKADDPLHEQHRLWLTASPDHAQEFAALSDVWTDFDSPVRLAALADAAEKRTSVALQRRLVRRRLLKGAVGAFAIATAGIVAWRSVVPSPESTPDASYTVVTGVGQITRQTFADGTHVTVNAKSRLLVQLFADRRVVKLDEGEVLFDVAHDASRPFTIESGPAKITVVGTRFQVSRLTDKVSVAVLEGTVRIDGASAAGGGVPGITAAAGDAVDVNAEHRPRRVTGDVKDLVAWEQGTLVFDKATLEEIATSVSRYQPRPVRVVDGAGDGKRITAVVQLVEINGFLATLPSLASVRVERGTSETLIVRR